MDNKQFLQKLLLDPSAAQGHTEADAQRRALIQTVQQQEQQIKQALDVPVPPELLTRLLEQQRKLEAADAASQKVKPANDARWKIAIAASVAFAIGLSVNIWRAPGQQDLGQYALAHVRSEMPMVEKMLMPQPLDGVNAKLAAYDLQLQDFAEPIMFANFCDFNGTKSLHLVMKTEQGFVTVFVVPADAELKYVDQFKDPQYAGTSIQFKTANVVVVSDVPSELKRMPAIMQKSLSYSI